MDSIKYYHPRMYMCSSRVPGTMGIAVTLKEPVNGDALVDAVEKLRERFPYYYVKAKAEENHLFPVPNSLPVVVRKSWEPILLGSKDANYHLTAFKFEGNRLAIEICHSVADGAALFPYLKSVLYCYICKVTGKELDPTGFRLPPLPGGVVPEAEIGDPFAHVDIDSAEKPASDRAPNMESYQLPKPTTEDGSKPECHAIYLSLPEDKVIKFCKDNGATPNVLMSVLLTRAVHHIDPDNKKTVSTLVALDPKAILGASESCYNFVSSSFIEFPGDHMYDDIREMCTNGRAQLKSQTQRENALFRVKMTKMTFEKMVALPVQVQMKVYSDFLKKHFATFSVSYASTRTFGPLDEYIQETFVLSEPNVTDLMLEVSCINGSFFLGFYQHTDNETFFEAFLTELNAIKVPYKILRKEPFRLCGVRYDGIEGLEL